MEIKQVKETCLYVQDLERSKYFYHHILGLPIYSMVENRHVFFKVGPSMLLCFLPEVTRAEQKLPPHYAYGKQHIALEVKPEMYERWRNELLQQGIDIIHEQQWKEGLHSFYFEDPDGHLIEIVPEGIWE
jgi:catechol 2,3-dioxygenase-like lactoylglutathione lyase family enzyme